ncbi:MAG: Asp-tRNA(Asn)/Glu-tRNA(Gln) amidotransferase subunit GatC [Chloroflexi bacterium]|nr:Asp-tRNA(Asn)/Glu-tRNA(Gln) amidotransferase subunit GatC [Chloroflexota bacterium]
MAEEITREIFDHMVELAALELDEEEAEYLRNQLNQQLNAIDELLAVPLDESVELASRGVAYTGATSQPLREDKAVGCENPEEIIAQAPQTEDNYIVVPDIPQEELK